jgi:acyl carrier protein
VPESSSAVSANPADAVLRTDQVPLVVAETVRLIAPHPFARLGAEHQLIDDLGFHSLALAELGFTLEDLFSLDAIAPERAMTLQSVGDIVALIEQALTDDQAQLPAVADVRAFCMQYGAAWDPQD